MCSSVWRLSHSHLSFYLSISLTWNYFTMFDLLATPVLIILIVFHRTHNRSFTWDARCWKVYLESLIVGRRFPFSILVMWYGPKGILVPLANDQKYDVGSSDFEIGQFPRNSMYFICRCWSEAFRNNSTGISECHIYMSNILFYFYPYRLFCIDCCSFVIQYLF